MRTIFVSSLRDTESITQGVSGLLTAVPTPTVPELLKAWQSIRHCLDGVVICIPLNDNVIFWQSSDLYINLHMIFCKYSYVTLSSEHILQWINATTSRKFLTDINSSVCRTKKHRLHLHAIHSLCNPRDHCTHSLFQDYCIVKLITSNHLTYLYTGTTLWRGMILYALVPKTMHGVIVVKRVRTRRLSDRYCTRVWMSGMIWCDH